MPTAEPREVNRYEIFLKVAELGNITRAAESLSYTQSGVSHAIRALERECHVSLLVRGRTGVTLTQAARLLLPHVQQLVNQQHDLAQAVQKINHVVAGTLRIGTFTSVSMQWLPGIIQRFQAQNPLAEFDIYDGGYEDISARLLQGRADCGFLAAKAVEPGLDFVPLKRDEMLAILPRQSPLAQLDAVPVERIAQQELVMPLRGSDRDIRAALAAVPGQLNVRYALNEDFSAMAMVEKGFGVSVMPELMLRKSRFELEVRPLEPRRYRTIGLATRTSEGLSALTRAFVEFLRSPNNADLLA